MNFLNCMITTQKVIIIINKINKQMEENIYKILVILDLYKIDY